MKTRTNSPFAFGLILCACGVSASANWEEPAPLVEVNTEFHDKSPFLSYDGLTLYFSIQDGLGFHYTRIYQATRPAPFGPFDPAKEISALNFYGGHVDYAWVSPDNLRMYYYRTEFGTMQRLKVTQRKSVDEPWTRGSDINELNAIGDVACPTLTQDELTIVFTVRDHPFGLGGYDIWTATRSNRYSSFGNKTNLTEINSSELDAHPSISPDGLTLYFDSDRNGTGQLFKATRASLDVPFGTPEHLSSFDLPDSSALYPSVSSDGKALYFVRWRESGTTDIHVANRSDAAEAKTYYVDGVGGDDLDSGLDHEAAFMTIQQAIDSAGDGDTVMVYPGVYSGEVNFKGKAITVKSVADAVILENPGDCSVLFYGDEGPDSVLENVIIRNSYLGVLIAGGNPTVRNVTIVDNECGIAAFGGSEPDISSSIFWNNTDADLIGCRASYSCTKQAGGGEGNIDIDPLFADPDHDDYHLLSRAGRYSPALDIWVIDNLTSLCIDAGDPATDPSGELVPNGDRINMGAYGGTSSASMSEMK